MRIIAYATLCLLFYAHTSTASCIEGTWEGILKSTHTSKITWNIDQQGNSFIGEGKTEVSHGAIFYQFKGRINGNQFSFETTVFTAATIGYCHTIGTLSFNSTTNEITGKINVNFSKPDNSYGCSTFPIYVYAKRTYNPCLKESRPRKQEEYSEPKPSLQGNGTGFVIDKSGHIATNWHVVKDASKIEIEIKRNGEKYLYKGEVVAKDIRNDLAIVRITDLNFKPYSKIEYNFFTKVVDIGTEIFTIGFPGYSSNEINLADGKITALQGLKGDISRYQTNAPINPGNSGGPVFDFNGNLVGIAVSKIIDPKYDNIAYLIKTGWLKSFIESIGLNLVLPNDSSIADIPLTEQIKVLENYVALIQVFK